jgi:hypothetical protein
MKTVPFIAGIAALLLVTGTAHAIEYECGVDTIRVMREDQPHAKTVSTLIRIESPYRKGKGPVIRYDVEKNTLIVDGKPCKGPNG